MIKNLKISIKNIIINQIKQEISNKEYKIV